jgi:putative transcriptional regulator
MNDELFQALLTSVQQADAIISGKAEPTRINSFAEPEVKAVRAKTGLTQEKFAMIVGVSKRTLENWEQGRRHPTGPARALLKILDADPIGAMKALQLK